MLSCHKICVFSFKDKTNKIDEKSINGDILLCYILYYIYIHTYMCIYEYECMYTQYMYVYIAE